MTATIGPISSVRTVPTSATRLLAVCGKCGKKIGGGFGKGRKFSLVKTLRRDLAAAKGKRAAVRVVETRCLGICPRQAVAMIDSQRPDAVLIVARDTGSDMIAERLQLPLAGD